MHGEGIGGGGFQQETNRALRHWDKLSYLTADAGTSLDISEKHPTQALPEGPADPYPSVLNNV